MIENRLSLTPDCTLFPGYVKYPITWTGTLDGQSVTIVQNESSSKILDSYDFSKLPEEFHDLKEDIVTYIDKKLKVMD